MYTSHSTLTNTRLFLEFNNRGKNFPPQTVEPFPTHGFQHIETRAMHFDPIKMTTEREVPMKGSMHWNPESRLFQAWFWHEEAIFSGISAVVSRQHRYSPSGPGKDSQPMKFNGLSVRSESETTTDLYFGNVLSGSGVFVVEPVPILPGDEIAEAVVEAVDRFLPHKLLEHLVA